MCKKVKCNNCTKWTWSGCGRHIEQALEGVPLIERCNCNSKNK